MSNFVLAAAFLVFHFVTSKSDITAVETTHDCTNKLYSQCAGIAYHGPTCCGEGMYCHVNYSYGMCDFNPNSTCMPTGFECVPNTNYRPCCGGRCTLVNGTYDHKCVATPKPTRHPTPSPTRKPPTKRPTQAPTLNRNTHIITPARPSLAYLICPLNDQRVLKQFNATQFAKYNSTYDMASTTEPLDGRHSDYHAICAGISWENPIIDQPFGGIFVKNALGDQSVEYTDLITRIVQASKEDAKAETLGPDRVLNNLVFGKPTWGAHEVALEKVVITDPICSPVTEDGKRTGILHLVFHYLDSHKTQTSVRYTASPKRSDFEKCASVYQIPAAALVEYYLYLFCVNSYPYVHLLS